MSIGVSAESVQGTPFQTGKREVHASWLQQHPNLKKLEKRVIFTAGIHKGTEYTQADLAEMVRAFEPTLNQIKPRVKLGHDEAQSYARLAFAKLGTHSDEKSLGMPALGYVDNPRLNDEYTDRNGKLHAAGTEILADFVNLDEGLYNDLMSLKYIDRSAEVMRNYQDKERPGVVWPRVLKNVAFLGDELPAVRDMAPLVELNSEVSENIETVTFRLAEECEDMAFPPKAGAPAAPAPPGTPASGPATLDGVMAGINKLAALMMQLLGMEKKEAGETPDAPVVASEDLSQRPGVDMAVPDAPAVPVAQGKGATRHEIHIHSEDDPIVKEVKELRNTVEKERSARLQMAQQMVMQQAEVMLKEQKLEAENFAESISNPACMIIPVEMKAEVAQLYQNAPDTEVFAEGPGAGKSYKQQLADTLRKLPVLASAASYKDRSLTLVPKMGDAGGEQAQVTNFAEESARKIAKEQGIPFPQALYRFANSGAMSPGQLATAFGFTSQDSQTPTI